MFAFTSMDAGSVTVWAIALGAVAGAIVVGWVALELWRRR